MPLPTTTSRSRPMAPSYSAACSAAPCGARTGTPARAAGTRVGRVGHQIEPLARPRQRHVQHLADARGRAVGHHDDAVGQQHRLVDVVRDHHHGVAELLVDGHHRVLQMRPRQRVERAERLVQQQHLGLHGQRAGEPTRCFMPPEISAGRLSLACAHLHEIEIVHGPVVALGAATWCRRTPCRRRGARCRRRSATAAGCGSGTRRRGPGPGR